MILGTGGGLRHARPWLDDGSDEPIVVVNGKILLDLDLRAVLRRHRELASEATMVLRPDPDAEQWGSFRVDADGRVVQMLGASPACGPRGEAVGAPLMFTGVHVLAPRFLDRIPPEGEQCVIRTAYRSLFHEGQGPAAFVTDRYWWEHSTPERYLQGVKNVLDGAVPLPYAEQPVRGVHASARIDPSATVVDPVWIGPGVEIRAGACVGPHVQLGAGAVVESGVRLENVVAWEDVCVDADAHDVVLTKSR